MENPILNEFLKNNKNQFETQSPDMFDPKWIIMESGWPWFRLSALDNQPWKEMHAEAEALLDQFHPHREDYGQGWGSLTLHGLNEDTQSLGQYGVNRNNTLNHKSLNLRVLPLLLLFDGLGTPRDSFNTSIFDFLSFDGIRSQSSAT